MKNCTDCKHALWDKTETGRLHPKGGGAVQIPVQSSSASAGVLLDVARNTGAARRAH